MAGHVEEHGPLIEAIVTGEPERAARLARGHVEGFEQATRAAIRAFALVTEVPLGRRAPAGR